MTAELPGIPPISPRSNVFEKEPLMLTNAEAFALVDLCKRLRASDVAGLEVDEFVANERLFLALVENGWFPR